MVVDPHPMARPYPPPSPSPTTVQICPASVVVRSSPLSFVVKQVVTDGQAMLVGAALGSPAVAVGTGALVQVPPESVVTRTDGSLGPTAKQFVTDGQAMAVRPFAPGGVAWAVHVDPESVVTRIPVSPAAKHMDTDGQAIPARPPVPDGNVSVDHVPPVSVVTSTSPAPELFTPAASQVESEGQDMACTPGAAG
jgi:hypothetical protein